MQNVYLLTGKPGTGKTTLIKEVTAGLNIKAGGFFTGEIRANGIRQGFQITAINGRSAVLSHVSISSPFRVSKYGVDTEVLNSVGVAALNEAIEKSDLIIVDEIGKMELFSPSFKQAVALAIKSGKKVLGTIMLASDPFADGIKQEPNVKILNLTRVNYDRTKEEIIQWLKTA